MQLTQKFWKCSTQILLASCMLSSSPQKSPIADYAVTSNAKSVNNKKFTKNLKPQSKM